MFCVKKALNDEHMSVNGLMSTYFREPGALGTRLKGMKLRVEWSVC